MSLDGKFVADRRTSYTLVTSLRALARVPHARILRRTGNVRLTTPS